MANPAANLYPPVSAAYSEYQAQPTQPTQPQKTPKYEKVDASVQKWARIVLEGKTEAEQKASEQKDRGFVKGAFYYARYNITNISFDGRSRQERKEDNYLIYGLIGLVAGTVAFFFWIADYNQVNHRMDKVEQGKKSLNKTENTDRKEDIKTRFNDAMEMLQSQKTRLQYKLAASGGLLGFSASMVVGSIISSNALMTIGALGALFTVFSVVAHTLATRRSYVYCAPKDSAANWFPLNWISKTERNAAQNVLGRDI